VAKSSLIEDYLLALAANLPAAIVAELADGLHETYLARRRSGVPDERAAQQAIAEFGSSDAIVAAFLASNPARRAARTLLLTGPLVGAAWATAVLTLHAWDWPVPIWVRLGFGTALVTGVTLLVIAAFGQRYRRATHSAAAACLIVLAIDASMLGYLAAAGLLTTWPALLAVPLSATRSVFTVTKLPAVVVGH
jgi:hypothetical protein